MDSETIPSEKESDLYGIEEELGNEDVKNEVPFNPDDISINIVPRTIGQLVEMLEYDEILIPKYQRRPDLWNDRKKSRFIESLMLRLPIPLFYFDEGSDKKWRVVDGLQRMSTLEHFILAGKFKDGKLSCKTEPLRLTDLEFRTEYNGACWDDLPRDLQRRIKANQVTINLIGKDTPDQVKYNIFSRINQGGVELKAQEIRTALFQGYRIDFLESLVSAQTEQGRLFKLATGGTVPVDRQEDLDFSTRFVSFYLIGYEQYEPSMDSYMARGTDSIPADKLKQQQIIDDFATAMKLAYDVFGEYAFRKRPPGENRRNRIAKPLFEVISVYFSKLTEEEQTLLIAHKQEFEEQFRKCFLVKDFSTAITTGTATKESVKTRHEEFGKLMDDFFKTIGYR